MFFDDSISSVETSGRDFDLAALGNDPDGDESKTSWLYSLLAEIKMTGRYSSGLVQSLYYKNRELSFSKALDNVADFICFLYSDVAYKHRKKQFESVFSDLADRIRADLHHYLVAVGTFIKEIHLIDPSKTAEGYFVAFTSFLHKVFLMHRTKNERLVLKAIENFGSIFKKCFSIPVEAQSQGESSGRRILDFFLALREDFHTKIDSSLGKMFVRLIRSIIASAMALSAGFRHNVGTILPSSLVKHTPRTSADIIMELGDSMLGFLDGSYQHFVEGIDVDFVHNAKSYAEWVRDVQFLVEKQHSTTTNEEVAKTNPNMVLLEDYFDVLLRTRHNGFAIITEVIKEGNPSDRNFFERHQATVMDLFVKKYVNGLTGLNRPTPLGVLIVGPPNVGKSFVTNAIFQGFHTLSGDSRPYCQDSMMFSVNADAKYLDGYQDQMYVVLDDVGKMRATASQIPMDYQYIISMINAIPWFPDKAALEDKGKVAFRAKVVVVTANDPDAGIPLHFSTPAAAFRRLNHRIMVTTPVEWQSQGINGPTGSLDSALVAEKMQTDSDSQYKCYHFVYQTFELSSLNPGKAGGRYVTVAEGSFDHVMPFFWTNVEKFIKTQRTSASLLNNVNLDLCVACKQRGSLCTCVPIPNMVSQCPGPPKPPPNTFDNNAGGEEEEPEVPEVPELIQEIPEVTDEDVENFAMNTLVNSLPPDSPLIPPTPAAALNLFRDYVSNAPKLPHVWACAMVEDFLDMFEAKHGLRLNFDVFFPPTTSMNLVNDLGNFLCEIHPMLFWDHPIRPSIPEMMSKCSDTCWCHFAYKYQVPQTGRYLIFPYLALYLFGELARTPHSGDITLAQMLDNLVIHYTNIQTTQGVALQLLGDLILAYAQFGPDFCDPFVEFVRDRNEFSYISRDVFDDPDAVSTVHLDIEDELFVNHGYVHELSLEEQEALLLPRLAESQGTVRSLFSRFQSETTTMLYGALIHGVAWAVITKIFDEYLGTVLSFVVAVVITRYIYRYVNRVGAYVRSMQFDFELLKTSCSDVVAAAAEFKRACNYAARVGARIEAMLPNFVSIYVLRKAMYTLIFLFSANKLRSWLSEKLPEAQGNTIFRERKHDPYKNESPHIAPMPVSTASLSSSPENLLNKLTKSMRVIVINGIPLTVLPVKGYDYICPAHQLPEPPFMVTLSPIIPDTRGVLPVNTLILDDTNLVIDRERDIALIRMLGTPNVPDFKKFFPPIEMPLGLSTPGYVIYVDHEKREVSTARLNDITISYQSNYQHTSPHDGKVTTIGTKGRLAYYALEGKGKCGGPVIMLKDGNKPVIAAVHVAGCPGENKGFGQCVSAAYIDTLSAQMKTLIPQSLGAGDIDLTCYNGEVPFLRPILHDKNLIRYIEYGCAEVYGELDLKVSKARHDVRESMIYGEVNAEFGDCGYRPPEFHVGHTRHGYSNPFQTAVSQIVMPVKPLPPAIVDAAARSFLNRILSKREIVAELELLEPLTKRQAINGIPGLLHVDGVKRKTSAGFGGFTSKTKFLLPDEDEEYPHGVKLIPLLDDHYDRIGRKLLHSTAGAVFQAHIKNEPVRVKPGPEQEPCGECDYNCAENHLKEPRIFTGTPFVWSLWVRKYFLPVVALSMRHSLTFECAVGTDAESQDWEVIYNYLTDNGKRFYRIIAGDYEKYDKRLPAILNLYAHVIMIVLCSYGKYNIDDITRMMGITGDASFPIVWVQYVLIKFFNSNPSGYSLTTFINSFDNSIIIRIAWILLGFPIEEFDANVSLITYGDDNIMGVSDKYDFNHTAIMNVLAQFGIKFTMADKDSDSVPFINMDQADFLKRGFKYDGKRMLAPLDFKSIIRMLSYTYDTTLEERNHCEQVLRDSLRYAVQHDKETYDRLADFVKRMCNTYKFDITVLPYEAAYALIDEKYEFTGIRH